MILFFFSHHNITKSEFSTFKCPAEADEAEQRKIQHNFIVPFKDWTSGTLSTPPLATTGRLIVSYM